MPLYSRDWRSPGELWIKTDNGWEKRKILEFDSSFSNRLKRQTYVEICEHVNKSVERDSSLPYSGSNGSFTFVDTGKSTRSCSPPLTSNFSSSLPDARVFLFTPPPYCQITAKHSREVGGCTVFSELFKRLDFKNALHDVRRFNYVSKVLELLVTRSLLSLSGNAQRVVFSLLEELALSVSNNKSNVRLLNQLITDLKSLLAGNNCFGKYLGSASLWKLHEESLVRADQIHNHLLENLNECEPQTGGSSCSSSSSCRLLQLPTECVRHVLLCLADHRDLESAAGAARQLAALTEETAVWRQLCRYHFSAAQIDAARATAAASAAATTTAGGGAAAASAADATTAASTAAAAATASAAAAATAASAAAAAAAAATAPANTVGGAAITAAAVGNSATADDAGTSVTGSTIDSGAVAAAAATSSAGDAATASVGGVAAVGFSSIASGAGAAVKRSHDNRPLTSPATTTTNNSNNTNNHSGNAFDHNNDNDYRVDGGSNVTNHSTGDDNGYDNGEGYGYDEEGGGDVGGGGDSSVHQPQQVESNDCGRRLADSLAGGQIGVLDNGELEMLAAPPQFSSCDQTLHGRNVSSDNNYSVDWKAVYHQLRRRHGLREDYVECVLLCRACRTLFWRRFGHPCTVDDSVKTNGDVATSADDSDGEKSAPLYVTISPRTLLTFLSL